MARMTAPERYAARQTRRALRLRLQTIQAADEAIRRLHLKRRFGPGWRGVVEDAWHRNLLEWYRIVEYHNPAGSGVSAPQENTR